MIMENNLNTAKRNNTELLQNDSLKVNLQIGVDFTLLSKSLKAFYKKKKIFIALLLRHAMYLVKKQIEK